MNKIKVLEKNTRDQIAAGEVAERPSLIIKELVENAIDAEATDIRITLKESGIEEIRVSDNGSGIEKEDIPLAFLRHATSKIRKIEDLNDLFTMGFRGEALASIAAVSKICLRTKTADSAEAYECNVEGGEISEIIPAAGNQGTEIYIHDLFYNTPARKKFLATPVREMREISDIIGRIIIVYPKIRFTLINNGKRIFLSTGNGDEKAAIAAIYGNEPLKFLIPISGNDHFTGYIAHPNYSKPNRNYYHFYINQRYIQSNELNKALENAFRTLLPERRFAVAFINVMISPDQYDINVHPNKLEVKFNRDTNIPEQLFQAIKETLAAGERSYTTEIHLPKKNEPGSSAASEEIPQMTKIHQDLRPAGLPGAAERKRKAEAFEKDADAIRAELLGFNRGTRTTVPTPKPKDTEEPQGKEFASIGDVNILLAKDSGTTDFLRQEESLPPVSVSSLFEDASEIKHIGKEAQIPHGSTLQDRSEETAIDFEEGFYSSLDILGQVGGSFIAACNKDALYLIDQHAAHERLLFNRIRRSLENGDELTQPLLVPQEVPLNYRQYQWVVENILVLHQMGFKLEEFGEHSFILREIPAWAEEIDSVKFLQEFADGWLSSAKKLTFETIRERKIMSKACKSAVKANQYLTKADILYLFRQLDQEKDAFTCPHGRPISVKFTINEIRRKFLRT